MFVRSACAKVHLDAEPPIDLSALAALAALLRNVLNQGSAASEAEAGRLCNAQRYERTEARRDTRAGHYERELQTKAGEVQLKVPKLRAQTFETPIIRALPAA